MRSIRLLGVSSASALWLAFAGAGSHACSSNDAPPPAGSSGSSGSVLDASNDRGLLPSDDAAARDAGSALPLGDLPTIDEPDVPCVATTGPKTELFAKGDSGLGGPAVTRVQLLGSRRFAAGSNTQGFITFDALGTTPKLFAVALGSTETVFSSEGSTIGAMAVSQGKIDYQRYDDQGAAMGATVSLATGIAVGPPRVWVASGAGGSLAVWPSGSSLFAAAVTAGGAAAGPSFVLASNAPSPKVAITYAGDRYAIVYSYATTGAASAARFVFASPTGLLGSPVDLATAAGIEPVAVTQTSSGFLLVVDAGGDEHVYTLPLDASGKVSGPAHRLLGGDLPWGLASHGNDAALVVLTNDVKVGNDEGPRAPQFRPLDVTGRPTGPWVCLDARIDNGLYQDMGILAEANGGYSVVYKSPADSTVLVRVDKLGTKAP